MLSYGTRIRRVEAALDPTLLDKELSGISYDMHDEFSTSPGSHNFNLKVTVANQCHKKVEYADSLLCVISYHDTFWEYKDPHSNLLENDADESTHEHLPHCGKCRHSNTKDLKQLAVTRQGISQFTSIMP